jgi:site-specific recombinase XerD
VARGGEDFAGPLLMWTGPLESWLQQAGCSPGRARRTVNAFGRLSTWMAARGLTVADLNEDVIDEHIRSERQRSGARSPAAVQYLPLAKRFLAWRGVLVLRGPASRDLGGVPRRAAGPLAGVVTELVMWLRAKGYAKGTALSVAGTAARLGAWMSSQKLDIDDLDGVVLERFVAAQSSGPHRHPSSARRIVTVRKFLIATGRLRPTEAPVPVLDAVGQCLQEWGRCVQLERGAGQGWISEQARWARGFLHQVCGPDGQICWNQVDVSAVNAYVAAAGRGYSLSSRQHLVAAMGSLLAWAFRTGKVPSLMGAGVLVPGRPRAGLPDVPTAGHVEAIIAAANRSVPLGRRDYAIAVMVSRLGLRAGEVAGLLLDDIDWHQGRITVCGKGGRILTLPLPESGTLNVLDGSHRWPDTQHARFFNDADLDAIEQQFAADGRTVTRVPFSLRKGQVSFHHGWTLHASLPNTSARVRLALAVHLQDVDNRYQPARTPDGRPIRIFDEQLCRVQPNGEPDFTDPDVFPTIWPVH